MLSISTATCPCRKSAGLPLTLNKMFVLVNNTVDDISNSIGDKILSDKAIGLNP